MWSLKPRSRVTLNLGSSGILPEIRTASWHKMARYGLALWRRSQEREAETLVSTLTTHSTELPRSSSWTSNVSMYVVSLKQAQVWKKMYGRSLTPPPPPPYPPHPCLSRTTSLSAYFLSYRLLYAMRNESWLSRNEFAIIFFANIFYLNRYWRTSQGVSCFLCRLGVAALRSGWVSCPECHNDEYGKLSDYEERFTTGQNQC